MFLHDSFIHKDTIEESTKDSKPSFVDFFTKNTNTPEPPPEPVLVEQMLNELSGITSYLASVIN